MERRQRSGKTTDCQNHPFIRFFSEESGLPREALVQSLINRNTGWWDTNMIQSLFTKAGAAQIFWPPSQLHEPTIQTFLERNYSRLLQCEECLLDGDG
jgi:hypothetical protein